MTRCVRPPHVLQGRSPLVLGGLGVFLYMKFFKKVCARRAFALQFPFSHPRFDRQAPEKSLKGRYGSLGSGDFDPNMFPGGLGGMGGMGMMGTRGSLQGDVHQAMMQVATFFVCLPAAHPPPLTLRASRSKDIKTHFCDAATRSKNEATVFSPPDFVTAAAGAHKR